MVIDDKGGEVIPKHKQKGGERPKIVRHVKGRGSN